MNKTLLLFSLIIFSTALFSQEKNRINIGMDMYLFKMVYPKVISANAPTDGQWGRVDTLYGLPGSWAYNFKDGKLDWCLWDLYIDSLSQINFDKCLAAAKALIKKYTANYGKPLEYKEVDTTYKDPYKQHHWGYDVIYAKWKTDKIKFKIEFTFLGGKGEYHFLVKMGFFDKDYPYWD